MYLVIVVIVIEYFCQFKQGLRVLRLIFREGQWCFYFIDGEFEDKDSWIIQLRLFNIW